MSMKRLSLHLAPRSSAPDPQRCAQLLGEYIQGARRSDGRPLEEIAPLAALTVAEWERIEAGEAPDTWEQVPLIMMALHLGRSWKQYLLPLWAGAKPLPVLGQ